MFRELRNRKTVDYNWLNDKGMEDAMKSEGDLNGFVVTYPQKIWSDWWNKMA